MEILDGKILVTRAELSDREILRQVDAIAAKALRDCCIMHSPDDMRSSATIAEDYGLLVVIEPNRQEQNVTVPVETLVS